MANNSIKINDKSFKVIGERRKAAEKIYSQREEFVKVFAQIKKNLYSMPIEQLLLLPAFARSKLRDENGHIEFEYEGYGGRILIVKLEDPWTDNVSKRQGKTAFLVYFSYQVSKPLVPAQMAFKIRSIFEVMKKLNKKGYRVYPVLFANNITPGALRILRNPKINIKYTDDIDDLFSWISAKITYRLSKIVKIAKFTLKFDKIFAFLRTIINGLGHKIPSEIMDEWVSKPVKPVRS